MLKIAWGQSKNLERRACRVTEQRAATMKLIGDLYARCGWRGSTAGPGFADARSTNISQ